MKRKMLVGMLLLCGITISLSAQEMKTEKFKVAGNCDMCKNRIEKAAKSVEGVTSANWDKDTKMIEVKFYPDSTSLHKIEMAIADAGHDTEMHKASDEVYNKLPGCCHYERMKDGNSGHN